jgi:hypothetical protein
MVIEWTYVIYLLIILNSFGFAYLVLKAWVTLKENVQNNATVKGNTVRINQLKRKILDIEGYLLEGGGGGTSQEGEGNPSALSLPDNLDDALKQWDIDSRMINNPMVKPLAEKIYKQIKDKAGSSLKSEDQDIDVGY